MHLPELDASAESLLQSSLDLHRKSDEMQVLHMLQNASQVTKYLTISQSSFGISLGLLDILSLSKPKAASSKLVMALRWLLSLGSFVAASSDAPEVVAPAGRLRGISDGEVCCARVGFSAVCEKPCDLADSSFRPCQLEGTPSRCRSTRFAAFPMRKLLLEHCVGVRRCH